MFRESEKDGCLSLKQKTTKEKANWYRRKRSLEMKQTTSRTLAAAARSPAAPAFVDFSLPRSFKHRSASTLSLSGEEEETGWWVLQGSSPQIFHPPKTKTTPMGSGVGEDGQTDRCQDRSQKSLSLGKRSVGERWEGGGRPPSPASKCGHLRRRAGHEEIHREAEVTSLGAGVLGGTVHV